VEARKTVPAITTLTLPLEVTTGAAYHIHRGRDAGGHQP
jgi:hypothetical protein